MEYSVKCLGVWWDSSLPSKTSIMERINKARSAFFSRGKLGAFHGLLNPLSSHSLIEYCIIPVVMYGSESWVLNSTHLSKLESFQAELSKRMFKLPKHTSNTIPLLVLNWPCVPASCVVSLPFYKVLLWMKQPILSVPYGSREGSTTSIPACYNGSSQWKFAMEVRN